MNTKSIRSMLNLRAGVALAIVGCLSGAVRLQAQTVVTYYQNTYHFQVTNYFCGAAAMEMMLDTPSITTFGSPNYNLNVANLLAAPDGGAVAQNPFPQPPKNGAQAAIYSLVHGGTYGAGNLYGGNSLYNNPPFGPGTDPTGFAIGLNGIDNGINGNLAANQTVSNWSGNGLTNNGSHAYAVYGGGTFPPNLVAANYASATVAAALKTFNVPASVSINNGGHWIDVNGVVTTSGFIGPNPTTFINGFFVRDPWTGYAQAKGLANQGLGKNTYLRYGYDNRVGGGQRLTGWFNYFTPAPNSSNAGLGTGYTIEVDPQGPELSDTGSDYSIAAAPTEGAEIDAPTARTDALNDLGTTAGLNLESGFEGGQFDPGNADDMLLQMPGDMAGEGDWLVPYDGSGGVNDVTGVALIDADTGVIDQATWLDPSDTGMTLDQVDQMFESIASGTADPADNFAPEPSSWVMMALGIAGVGLFARRCRRAAIAA